MKASDCATHCCFKTVREPLDSETVTIGNTSEPESELTIQNEEVEINNQTNLEELFIALVAEKRPLWDHTLDLVDRSKSIRDQLWKDIHENLNCAWPLESLPKKWKSLRDRFFKIKHEMEYLPSGSSSSTKKIITWKYYEMLQFLCDVNVPRSTVGSGKENKEINIIQSGKKNPSMKRKEREIDEEILAIIKSPPQIPNSPPQVNPVCLRLSEILSNLPIEKRAKLEIEFLQKAWSVQLATNM